MKTQIAAAAGVLCLASNAIAQSAERPKFEAIVPEGQEWIPEEYGFSPAVRAGDFVFAAGIVAGLRADENGVLPEATEENITAAYERAFDNIAIVLEAAGVSWGDVVEMTTFHTDLPAQGQIFLKVKERYVKAPYPAWTAIDIDRLWPDSGITEIRVTAYAPRMSE